ncbi:MAG TPA: VWA domain-containing protein [Bacteroidia bacterium]|nr:VWA domain-containing protein [Bacteroidia bacterium]
MSHWWYSIAFADKWVLWFLTGLPVAGFFAWYAGRRGKPALALSSMRYLKNIPVPAKVKWKPVMYFFRLAAIALLIMACARPQSVSPWRNDHTKGIDIMLAIDVSPSMQANDFYPTRMEAAKAEAEKFVDDRPNDRIGVVIFSGETFTLCPLTADHDALKTMIENINPGSLDMGTAIGMGLAKSVERLKSSDAKSKVVVLLTDGENNAGVISPVDAARLAKTFHVKVYTIGMGAMGGKVLMPTAQNPDGSYVQQYTNVDIDEKTLMDIASTTGAKYFRASDTKKLDEIYSEINTLEKSDVDKKERQDKKEEFLPLLFGAVFFLLVEVVFRYTIFNSVT